jgi:hypothetical protein
MMAFTKQDAKDWALLMRKANKTPAEEKRVSFMLASLSKVQKIWLNDELGLLDKKNEE